MYVFCALSPTQPVNLNFADFPLLNRHWFMSIGSFVLLPAVKTVACVKPVNSIVVEVGQDVVTR